MFLIFEEVSGTSPDLQRLFTAFLDLSRIFGQETGTCRIGDLPSYIFWSVLRWIDGALMVPYGAHLSATFEGHIRTTEGQPFCQRQNPPWKRQNRDRSWTSWLAQPSIPSLDEQNTTTKYYKYHQISSNICTVFKDLQRCSSMIFHVMQSDAV